MTPTSEPPITSPISNLPYDVLREIFTHCLPQFTIPYRQPDTRIAPILLCHICSSWRTVALTSPIIWARLLYRFIVVEDDDDSEDDDTSHTVAFDEHDIEFIQWWKINQGSIAPFLRLSVNNDDEHCNVDYSSYQPVAGGKMDFLLEYITSAQYLELDNFFWTQILEKMKAGYEVAFPNLHTLSVDPVWANNQSFYHVQSLISAQTQPALRRLSIGHDRLSDHFIIPNYWSTLSHISLFKVSISLEFWFSLIRAVPNLRWGHFEFSTLTSIHHIKPPQYTLPQLSLLSVALHSIQSDSSEFSLSLLFTSLFLPTLRTLSLSSSRFKSWEDHRAITQLYNVLKSTPAITKLALQDHFLSLDMYDTGVLLAAIGNVDPVWNYATQLTHLQLNIPYVEEPFLVSFAPNIFSSDNMWLDLQNPACPIRRITICTRSGARVRELAISEFQRNTLKAPKVAFHFTWNMADMVAGKMQDEWYSAI